MSIFLSAELLGYYTEGLSFDSLLMTSICYYIFGSIFIVLGLTEIFVFHFRPDKLNIVID